MTDELTMLDAPTMHRAITPEELNESLARRDRPRQPGGRDTALIGAIGHEIAERDRRIEVLEQRLVALEKKFEQRRYVGVWAVGKYFEGQLCTFDGSMWHCNVETEQRPGTGPDWTLAIKHGRDGRDGKDADTRRSPTAQRA